MVGPMMSLGELAKVIQAGQDGGMGAALEAAYGKSLTPRCDAYERTKYPHPYYEQAKQNLALAREIENELTETKQCLEAEADAVTELQNRNAQLNKHWNDALAILRVYGWKDSEESLQHFLHRSIQQFKP